MTRPIVVPDSLRLDPLLTLLREEGQLAVVLDEYGDQAGIVTIEDVIEEIVGDIADEHDRLGARGRRAPRRVVDRSPACCGPTRSRTSPASSCPTTRTTTPSPGWCSRCSAGCRSAATSPRSPVPDRSDPDQPERQHLACSPSSTWTGCASTGSRCGCSTDPRRGLGKRVRTDEHARRRSCSALFLLLGNAFFVAAEFALVSARRTQIEPRAEEGSRLARTTLRAMENMSLVIGVNQLGITVCSLVLGAVAEPTAAQLLEPLLARRATRRSRCATRSRSPSGWPPWSTCTSSSAR